MLLIQTMVLMYQIDVYHIINLHQLMKYMYELQKKLNKENDENNI